MLGTEGRATTWSHLLTRRSAILQEVCLVGCQGSSQENLESRLADFGRGTGTEVRRREECVYDAVLEQSQAALYPALKKGDRAHFALCHKRCFKQFMECLRKAGLLQEFSVLDAAMAWVKSHRKEIVGSGTKTALVSFG